MAHLYRPSDYIGGPVFHEYRAVEALQGEGPTAGDNDDVDRQLIDPTFAPPDGDLAWPLKRGHSNYFADKAFPASRTTTLELHRRRRAPLSRQRSNAGCKHTASHNDW